MKALKASFENELQKLITTKRVVISLSVLLFCVLFSALSFRGQVTNENWREYVTDQIKQSQDWIVEYSKNIDENRELIKEEQNFILLCRFRLENDIPPVENVFKFILDAFSFETAIILLCIVISIFCVCNEYTNSTILVLLTSGEKRINLLLAKFITIILYNFVIIIAYFAMSFLVGLIVFGRNGFSTFEIGMIDGTIHVIELVPQIASTFVVVFFRCLFYSSLGFILAIAIKNQTIVTIITFAIWIFGGALSTVLPVHERIQRIIVLFNLEILSDALVTSVRWDNHDFLRAFINVLVHTSVNTILGIFLFIRNPLPSKYK